MKKLKKIAIVLLKLGVALTVLVIFTFSLFSYATGRKLEGELNRLRREGTPTSIAELEAAWERPGESYQSFTPYVQQLKKSLKGISLPAPQWEDAEKLDTFDRYANLHLDNIPVDLLPQFYAASRRMEPVFAEMESKHYAPDLQWVVDSFLRPNLQGDNSLREMAHARNLARAISREYLIRLKMGDSSTALRRMELGLKLSDEIAYSPGMIHGLVAAGCQQILNAAVQESVTSDLLSTEDAEKIYTMLADNEERIENIQGRSYEGEMVFSLLSSQAMGEKAVSRIITNPASLSAIRFAEKSKQSIGKSVTKDDFMALTAWYDTLGKSVAPVHARTNASYNRLTAELRATRILLAAYQVRANTGSLPATLGELETRFGEPLPKVPITNANFKYTVKGDTVRVEAERFQEASEKHLAVEIVVPAIGKSYHFTGKP